MRWLLKADLIYKWDQLHFGMGRKERWQETTERAHLVHCLLVKYKDLRANPQHQCKNLGTGKGTSSPILES